MITQATDWLEKAVTGLRAVGHNDVLPRGLLTRATLQRLTENYPLAQQDLQEAHDIAEPSGMCLHLTDYHLEAARLACSMGEAQTTIQHHLQTATELIQQTGYHRHWSTTLELYVTTHSSSAVLHTCRLTTAG